MDVGTGLTRRCLSYGPLDRLGEESAKIVGILAPPHRIQSDASQLSVPRSVVPRRYGAFGKGDLLESLIGCSYNTEIPSTDRSRVIM